MKPLFKKRILATLCLSISSQAALAADDLLISEYVEGSSYNKAIEIFNETGSSIDLSSYQLVMVSRTFGIKPSDICVNLMAYQESHFTSF